jgi:hypothetical protein
MSENLSIGQLIFPDTFTDPAVYPHFELWPAVSQPQMAPFPKPCSRLTHSELHAMVMTEKIGSTGSFGSLAHHYMQRPFTLHKSHHDLHKAVFPGGIDFSNPNGTRNVYTNSEPGARPRQSYIRPPSARLGLPSSPSPNRGLPAPPTVTSGSRLSSAFESMHTLVFEDGAPPPTRISPIRRMPQSRVPVQGIPEQRPSTSDGLTRSPSMALPSPVMNPGHDRLDRSHSLSTTRPAPRRRDSIVLQRVKAYNACTSGRLSRLYTDLTILS